MDFGPIPVLRIMGSVQIRLEREKEKNKEKWE